MQQTEIVTSSDNESVSKSEINLTEDNYS